MKGVSINTGRKPFAHKNYMITPHRKINKQMEHQKGQMDTLLTDTTTIPDRKGLQSKFKPNSV